MGTDQVTVKNLEVIEVNAGTGLHCRQRCRSLRTQRLAPHRLFLGEMKFELPNASAEVAEVQEVKAEEVPPVKEEATPAYRLTTRL